MIKKLSKYGNTKALVIDKPILKLLNINENTRLEISTDGQSLIITPIQKGPKKSRRVSPDKKMQKLFEETIKEYEPALKKLAKR